MPFFSVIVPIYSVEKYLVQCIESVLCQDFTDFELILVDDGSPDNCSKICEDYSQKDNRVRVIHKENGGLVSARKAGARICCGKYVIPLDGDDWLESKCLSNIFDKILKFSPDIVITGFLKSSNSSKTSFKPRFNDGLYSRIDIESKIIPFLIENNMSKCFSPSIWAKAFKRSLCFVTVVFG